jgi:hypothetical protein
MNKSNNCLDVHIRIVSYFLVPHGLPTYPDGFLPSFISVAYHSGLVLHFLLAPQNKTNPPRRTRAKKNAFWAYRSAGPEAGHALLGRARLGCMR